MADTRILSTLSAVLVLTAAPATMTLTSSIAMAQAPSRLITGRSAYRMHRRRPAAGSYTNGKPDGANTGSRKQSPTGGNPGGGSHS